MSDEYDFDAPDHCTVGVVGEVGQRLFLFYCRQGLSETTVKVEKQQQHIDNQEKRDMAAHNGHLTKGEQAKLNKEQNKASENIYDKKHNDAVK